MRPPSAPWPALMDLGLSIPGDVSVLGFDNTNLGEEFRPRLTCVSQPIHDLIVQSLELLYAGMKQAALGDPAFHHVAS